MGSAEETKEDVKLHPLDIDIMRRHLADLVLQEINKIDNFWKYRYRYLLSYGIDVKYSSNMEFELIENGVRIRYILVVEVPPDLVIDLAKRKKRRELRLPKLHPIYRQRLREMMQIARQAEEELKKALRETLQKTEEEEEEEEEEHAEGNQNSGS